VDKRERKNPPEQTGRERGQQKQKRDKALSGLTRAKEKGEATKNLKGALKKP